MYKCLLVVYDQGSFISTFPHGLAYIAAVLKKVGVEVEIYNQDMHHYEKDHLTHYLDEKKFDLVGVNIIGGYWQYKKLLEISEAINKSTCRPIYILGGHGVTPEPKYFLEKTGADFVVMGEGEETIVELVSKLHRSDPWMKEVKGLAYHLNDRVYINERRTPTLDIDNFPLPAWELFPIEYYRLLRYVNMNNVDFIMPVLSGRGCPFKCNFCFRHDEGYRPRRIEAIIEEIFILKEKYRINVIDFSDELLMSSIPRTIEICEAFLKVNLNIKWHCNGRLNFAKPHVLDLMKKAGCIFINYGIEALDNQVLENMHKALNVKQIIEGVENTLQIGISPGLNVLWGNIGDTEETLKKGVDFLLKYDDCAQLRTIRPVTPYPGSELYYKAIELGLLGGVKDFYENKHINSDLLAVNFTNLSDESFHQALMEANTALLTNYYQKKLFGMVEITKNLYLGKNRDFRGYRNF